MNKLQKSLGITTISILGILAVGYFSKFRKEYKIEYSEVKHKEAIVVYRKYTPEYYETKVMPIGGMIGGMPVTMLVPIKHYYPAKYDIIFKANNKQIFKKFKMNDLAEVSYREKYKSIYDDTNGDNIKELIKKEFIKYEFIDAKLLTNYSGKRQ